jgi:hypothetical protein
MKNAPKNYVVSWRNVVMAMHGYFNAKQNDKKMIPTIKINIFDKVE